jgi:hypothetical protein
MSKRFQLGIFICLFDYGIDDRGLGLCFDRDQEKQPEAIAVEFVHVSLDYDLKIGLDKNI